MSFLDECPSAITKLIFDMKLEMEKCELRDTLNTIFRCSVDYMWLQDKNCRDGIYHCDHQ